MNKRERKRLLGLERRRPGLPEPGGDRPLRVGALYPQAYELAMSGLGIHFLYRTLAGWKHALPDRFFLPPDGGAPRSLERGWRLSDVHLLAATLPYEEDYATFLSLLLRAGIPPLARDRSRADPLVLVGGPAVASNPAPLARIYDAAVLGDGEQVLRHLEEPFARLARGTLGKEGLLEEASGVPGVYVPALGREAVTAAPPADLSAGGAASAFVTPLTHFGDTALIEIARGCTSRCRFCMATQIYRSMRPVPEARIDRELEAWAGVARRIGLVSVSLTDHPRFADLLGQVRDRGFELSLSSLRVDSVTDRELDVLSGVGVETLTLAPETGSDRLRRVVRKRVTNERILQMAEALGDSPIRTLKLYFIYGLPTETDEDLRAIGELAGELRERLGRGRVPTRLSLSINPLMAKPQTPYQFFGLCTRSELRRRARVLARAVGKKAHLSVDLKGIPSALDQTAIALGDDRTGLALLGSLEHGIPLAAALREEGVDYDALVHGAKGRDHVFPWDFFVEPARREGFYREFRKSFAQEGLEADRTPLHLKRARRQAQI